MLERIAEQPRLTSTADICTQNKMTPSHFSFVSHFPLAFLPFWLLQGWEDHLSAETQTSEKTQQVHLTQSNPEKSLLVMSKDQLFATATPKGAPLPDSFIITHKPGLHKIKLFNQSSIWTNQGMLKSHTAVQVMAHHLWQDTISGTAHHTL